jgi:preprotein translocase subunit SecD
MKQKTRHILILVVVAALLGVSIYFIYPPGQKTHLGLDLQGGLEVVYQASTSNGQPVTSDQMTQTLGIIDRRVNGLGVTESQVQQQGSDQISVALPGVTNAEQALAIIGKTAQLEFYDDGKTRVAGPESSKDALFQAASGKVPKADLTALRAGKAVADYRVIVAPPGKFGDNKVNLYFLYRHKPAMTGAAIQSARQSYYQISRPNVLIDFTSAGGNQFEAVTKQLAIRGALESQNQSFAIVLDNVMESDPIVDYAQNPQGIAGGKAEITGSFSIQEAKDLALVLNTGALPVTLEPIQKQQVSATLGKDSLRAGLIAGVIGMIIVLVFMVVVYRFLGIIADLALIIYAVLLWGVFNAVPVTLTLPGIAGMILTIGVAADANVVVFERIKEEVRRGKSVRSAINSGYGKGFRTILDANILIILTALVLFYFATAQPKGFALTLMIGTVVSLFTAVLATRAMLGLLSGFSFFDKGEFMGAHAGEELFAGEFAYEVPQGDGTGRRGRRAAAARSVTPPAVQPPVAQMPAEPEEQVEASAPARPSAGTSAGRRPAAVGRNGQRRPPAKKRRKRR